MGHNKGKISKARRTVRQEIAAREAMERAERRAKSRAMQEWMEKKANEVRNNSFGVSEKH
jgi:hypothetical protein